MQRTDHVDSSGQGQSGLLSSAQSHSVLSHLRLVTIWQNLGMHFGTSLPQTFNYHTNCMHLVHSRKPDFRLSQFTLAEEKVQQMSKPTLGSIQFHVTVSCVD